MAGEYINDEVFDQGLDYLTANATRIYVTSQAATTFAEASSTYNLGVKATVTVGATENGATDGRAVTVSGINGGAINTSGTATHWALCDTSSILFATGPLSASVVVTSGDSFSLSDFQIVIRDATVT